MSILNNILVDYVIRKRNLITSYIGPNKFITNDDIHEVKGWRYEVCLKILIHMLRYKDFNSDYTICPWCCIVFNSIEARFDPGGCYNNCKYGKRHGICSGTGKDTYGKIYRKIKTTARKRKETNKVGCIMEVPGIIELVEETNSKTKSILSEMEALEHALSWTLLTE